MIDHRTLDELTNKLLGALPDSARLMQRDIEANLRAILEGGLRKMNLVSREEFDVQTALLSRLQEKLRVLEQQVQDLEKSRL